MTQMLKHTVCWVLAEKTDHKGKYVEGSSCVDRGVSWLILALAWELDQWLSSPDAIYSIT